MEQQYTDLTRDYEQSRQITFVAREENQSEMATDLEKTQQANISECSIRRIFRLDDKPNRLADVRLGLLAG